MGPVYRMATVSLVFFGLIFLPVREIPAESIYHWKDSRGVSRYSNTNVPKGAAEISVMSTVWSVAVKTEDPETEKNTSGGANEMPAVSGSSAMVLEARIERRQASIHFIENLLKTNPHDALLRQHFFRQKQYLHEDRVRLGLLTK